MEQSIDTIFFSWNLSIDYRFLYTKTLGPTC